MKITKIIGREIFDSRGTPTIECELFLEDGSFVRSSVPSGASKGKDEAYELRDEDDRLMGQGVSKAIDNIEKIIAPNLEGNELNPIEMDKLIIKLDGTENKFHLGANATLAVSMALYKAQAYVEGEELYEFIARCMGTESVVMPHPLFNFVNGGAHADNNIRIQEFLIIPVGFSNFRESMEGSLLLRSKFKEILIKNKLATCVGDEGGFAPNVKNDLDVFDYLIQASDEIKLSENVGFIFGIDVAASQFYDPKKKIYNWNGARLKTKDLIELYKKISDKYPVYYIEDGLAEDDLEGWLELNTILGSKIQIVGDDIFTTNPKKIIQGIENNLANTVIIKPNQIGTVLETLQTLKLCKENDLYTVVSHRSGETNDSFIADLAVGASSGQIKAGGLSRGERLAKYNRLIQIEDRLISNLL